MVFASLVIWWLNSFKENACLKNNLATRVKPTKTSGTANCICEFDFLRKCTPDKWDVRSETMRNSLKKVSFHRNTAQLRNFKIQDQSKNSQGIILLPEEFSTQWTSVIEHLHDPRSERENKVPESYSKWLSDKISWRVPRKQQQERVSSTILLHMVSSPYTVASHRDRLRKIGKQIALHPSQPRSSLFSIKTHNSV
jgi:hypothetical protein